MTKLIVFDSVTRDGVMQGPGRRDEDRRGGFKHGGWSVPYASAETGKLAAEGMQTTGALLLGRRTYEDLLPHWNKVGVRTTTAGVIAATYLRTDHGPKLKVAEDGTPRRAG